MLRTIIGKLLCVALVSCLLPAAVYAEATYQFRQTSIEHGLSQSTVTAILRDSRGALWIGTHSGLNRFTKSGIRSFFSAYDNPGSLPGNVIVTLAEDACGNIWVGTSRGLAVYDRSSDSFVMRTDDEVFSALTTGGQTLFGGEKCLLRYDCVDDSLTRISIEMADETEQSYNIRDIRLDERGGIILGATHGRIYRFLPENETFIRNDRVFVPYLYCMFPASDGCFYVSSYKEGLYRFDPDGRLTAHWTGADPGLGHNIVTDIVEPRKGQLWMSTDGGGICILDLKEESFSTIRHSQGDPNSLPTNQLTLLYVDSSDNIWAGTVRNGLLGIRQTFIRSFGDVVPIPGEKVSGLSRKSVISLFEDNDKILWIGTDGGGINAYDPKTGAFHHFPSTYPASITSITDLDENTLFVSIFNRGTFLFSKADGRLTPFMIRDSDTDHAARFSGITSKMHRVGPDKIYILTNNIYIYRPSTGTFTEMNSLPGDHIPPACEMASVDDEYSYVISANSVYRIDQKSDILHRVVSLKKGENITSACTTPGRLWIGSDLGMSLYDLGSHSLRRIPTKLFNTISHIVPDGEDRLWICANSMLFSYGIADGKFSVWGESDGFSPNEIIRTFQSPSLGRYIYMGGVNGLVVIDRSITADQDDAPTVMLSEVMLNGRTVSSAGGRGGGLRIPHDYSSLTLRTDVMEKDILRKAMFRYIIEGPSVYHVETWDYDLSLPMLPPGNYVISAACILKNGEWTVPRELLMLSVIPPWWASMWAMLCFSAAGLLMVFAAVYYIHRRNELRFRWKVTEYERQANEKKIRFLINVSHELRTPLTLIRAPLKRLANSLEDGDPQKEKLAGIYQQAGYMADVVNMVLDVDKLDGGDVTVSLSVLPLNEWLERLVASFRTEFAERGIELVFTHDERIGNMEFDESKIRIAVSNLLSNALKFSHAGTRVTVSTALVGEMVRVSVEDQGVSLKNVDVGRLFTRFYQGEHNQKGSGIGLAYSRQLIELHGGVIRAFDNEAGGATFQFDIPAACIAEDPANIVTDARCDISAVFTDDDLRTLCSQYSILVVEDNEELRDFLYGALKDYFKSVHWAADGEQGLEITRDKRPDIVVSDIMMPRMNGFELCRNIREDILISHTMIVLLTAMSDPQNVSQGYKLGADMYIAKPFEIDMLLTRIYNQLRARERILRMYAEGLNVQSIVETTASSADEHFLQKLNDLIRQHMDDSSLDVNLLARKMAVGRTTFYQKVKILTGMSVNDYLNRMRIGHAAHLLIYSEKTVGEIADEVGYAYQRYFSTLFKHMTGMTPTQYRNDPPPGNAE